MINWKEKQTLEEKKEKLLSEAFELTEKLNFAKELENLCRTSDAFTSASNRLEYAETENAQTLKEFEENELIEEVNFYFTFVEFIKKYNSESTRIYSKMGSKTSEIKKKTSAENGKKGGRPRKN